MNDGQLLRYSRHILLDALGIEGQERILKSRVLVLGAGGLGSPAALYLASAGVGTLVLADGDTVDTTNLQRQILHTDARVGQLKALSGQIALAAVNPETRVIPVTERLEGAALEAQVAEADLVLDCCDNFATRHALNQACIRHRKPLVSGAAVRFDGQVSVYDLSRPESPCYHCLFPEGEEVEETRCAVMGVFAPLTGIVGSLQASEALKLLAGIGEALVGRLLLVDALSQTWRTVKFRKDPACPVCSDQPT
ncbi:molybdopterin-synthase adenylyltransferase MoeB [Azovibrio restrictus]|uniref:HesA/MoeB/ThiF family protein n=1 Tax=Azovibrio restrictus TaxID=146938 RepID=UPI0026EE4B7E|nr:molybdopterin-synthase adenylyltransferase MoeB [Azovibrio restrictus]MDD3482241.1 molybdopterin-synthase adenylyltransferase MoeB [Azovibrio restrictus]